MNIASTTVLWHPEGRPESIKCVVDRNRYYGRTIHLEWYRLSDDPSEFGWRVPVFAIDDKRTPEFDRLIDSK